MEESTPDSSSRIIPKVNHSSRTQSFLPTPPSSKEASPEIVIRQTHNRGSGSHLSDSLPEAKRESSPETDCRANVSKLPAHEPVHFEGLGLGVSSNEDTYPQEEPSESFLQRTISSINSIAFILARPVVKARERRVGKIIQLLNELSRDVYDHHQHEVIERKLLPGDYRMLQDVIQGRDHEHLISKYDATKLRAYIKDGLRYVTSGS